MLFDALKVTFIPCINYLIVNAKRQLPNYFGMVSENGINIGTQFQ